jgi:predicted Zn-dependent protease
LQNSVNDTNFKFKYYIVEDSELNAFALPGGHVVIHSGLILNADSYEELAGVLAHELSHVTLRHHARGLINNIGVMAILGGVIGDGEEFLGSILYGGAQLSLLKHSRDLEEESDEQGWEYLLKAGIDPKGMISFFRKLEKEHEEVKLGKEADAIMSFMSTHPETKERIKILEQKLSETTSIKFSPVKEDFNLFKEKLKSKI